MKQVNSEYEDDVRIKYASDPRYLFERAMIMEPIITEFGDEMHSLNGLDVGCGRRKSHEFAIGVDLDRGYVKPGEFYIKPEVVCNGDDLIFKNNSINWITSAHTIEHFTDCVKVLNEWLRVLKFGGIISLIIPDGRYCTTPLHKHDFTPDRFREEVVDKLINIKVMAYNTYHNNWSFNCVIKKTDEGLMGLY